MYDTEQSVTLSDGVRTGTYYGTFSYSPVGLTGGTITGYDAYPNSDTLLTPGVIGQELGDALKAEARRRAARGEFFGHIGYASLLARKPA